MSLNITFLFSCRKERNDAFVIDLNLNNMTMMRFSSLTEIWINYVKQNVDTVNL